MTTKLIAELSMNFMGDMELAEEMISAAAHAGADYVKFQTWKVDKLVEGPWDNDGRREVYEKAELSEADHEHLKVICEANGTKFLTSVFSPDLLPMVSGLSDSVKIASTECCNRELIDQATRLFENVFVSVGATNAEDYRYLADIENVYMLHCVSAYPCPADQVNMPRLDYIRSLTPRFGYSGHYFGIWDAIAAISRGATVVEKHFTTDQSLPFRDNQFAILPQDLALIREYADEFDRMNIDHGVDIQSAEAEVKKAYSGRWMGTS